MAKTHFRMHRTGWSLTMILAGVWLAGCGGPITDGGPEPVQESTPNDPFGPFSNDPFDPNPDIPCDPSISVRSDGPALLVNDPAILESFTLERVLQQILDRAGQNALTPEELLQRLFDTENSKAGPVFADNLHCDSEGNGAFKNGPSVNCPRAEGALAKSPNLFTPGHPDSFEPIALVNRFDLTTTSLETCGEYRIVYAKRSGRDDPKNRLFLIFEGAQENPIPGNVMGCRAFAKLWASLEKEADPDVIADRLETFYFDGLSGFAPLVDANHFGLKANDDDGYGNSRGQVRVSQQMQDPWEMREFRLKLAGPGSGGPPLFFAPVTVKNNPVPSLFDAANETPQALEFRVTFTSMEVSNLSYPSVTGLRMQTPGMFNAGESAVSGPAQSNYTSLAMGGGDSVFADQIAEKLAFYSIGKDCPPGDPLTAESILNRAATQSCAGCHAPEKFLGPERKIGCGLVWPSTLGEVHIDEKGALSPALVDVFLPRRASVMETFLQACDMDAIQQNLQPSSGGAIPK